jgi:hypothetical protein
MKRDPKAQRSRNLDHVTNLIIITLIKRYIKKEMSSSAVFQGKSRA